MIVRFRSGGEGLRICLERKGVFSRCLGFFDFMDLVSFWEGDRFGSCEF